MKIRRGLYRTRAGIADVRGVGVWLASGTHSTRQASEWLLWDKQTGKAVRLATGRAALDSSGDLDLVEPVPLLGDAK